MKDIFTDLYKKVIGFFQNAPEQDTENAKDVARNRLKLVLMQDRTNLTPYLLERMRGEMIEVLSKYVEMDKDELELNFEQEGEGMALMLSIPVVRAKDEEEIQAILDKEDKKKTDDEDVSDGESEEELSEEKSEDNAEAENDEEKQDEEVSDSEIQEEEPNDDDVLPGLPNPNPVIEEEKEERVELETVVEPVVEEDDIVKIEKTTDNFKNKKHKK